MGIARTVSFLFVLSVATVARAENSVGDGIAANISAAAPIAVAGIQAGTDRAIAGINARAAVQMSLIESAATEYIADDQAQVAIYQALTAQRINNINQQGVTDRLAMQLESLREARHDAEQAEREKMMIEYQYNEQRIRLAKYEADQQAALARMQFGLQMTMAGMSGPFGYGNSSRLTISNAIPASLRSTTPSHSPPGSSPDNSRASIAQTPDPTTKPSGNSGTKIASRLLANVGQSTTLPNGNKVASDRLRVVRGAQRSAVDGNTIFVGDNVLNVMDQNVVARGSFPDAPVRIAAPETERSNSLTLVKADGGTLHTPPPEGSFPTSFAAEQSTASVATTPESPPEHECEYRWRFPPSPKGWISGCLRWISGCLRLMTLSIEPS